jgi:hypothetical protein
MLPREIAQAVSTIKTADVIDKKTVTPIHRNRPTISAKAGAAFF